MGTFRVIIGFTSDCGGCGAASLQWSFLETPSCRRTAAHSAICKCFGSETVADHSRAEGAAAVHDATAAAGQRRDFGHERHDQHDWR